MDDRDAGLDLDLSEGLADGFPDVLRMAGRPAQDDSETDDRPERRRAHGRQPRHHHRYLESARHADNLDRFYSCRGQATLGRPQHAIHVTRIIPRSDDGEVAPRGPRFFAFLNPA